MFFCDDHKTLNSQHQQQQKIQKKNKSILRYTIHWK